MPVRSYDPHPMSATFRFDDFELDIAAYTLRRGGERLKLEKIPMDMLILLVEHAGALVERKRLHSALWGGAVFVDRDAGINTAIRKIREALGDNAEEPRLIETIVGKGYRFIAPIQRTDAAERRLRASGREPGPFPTCCVARGARQFVLHNGENLLGRDPEARVSIDHPSVSRRHARICVAADRVMLEDLNSRNGTFLDGRRIDAPTEIRNGAFIGLGPIAVTFVVMSGTASTRSSGRPIVRRMRPRPAEQGLHRTRK